MNEKKLKIRLFGPFRVSWDDGNVIPIQSAKLNALIALLACDGQGTRTRPWLQDRLWGRVGVEHGMSSLRQAVRQLRKTFGEDCNRLFDISNEQIQLKPSGYVLDSGPEDGEFLEGMDIAEPGFEKWLRLQRARPFEAAMLPALSRDPARVLPSIAVLPFTRHAIDKSDAGVGDMLAQELTRTLSRSSLLEVISHLSCRNVDSKKADLRRLKRLLGVDYIILGQYFSLNGVIRLDIELVETDTGRIIWTDEFQTRLDDFFMSGREMILNIARQTGQCILNHSIELASTHPIPDVQNHHLLMSSITLMHSFDFKCFSRARTQLEALIERVENVSVFHAWLAQWYNFFIHQGWSLNAKQDGQKALDCAKRAVDINPNCSLSLTMYGVHSVHVGHDFGESEKCLGDALNIEPNNALAWLYNGMLQAFSDKGDDAVVSVAKARRLSPLDPFVFLYDSLSATASLSAGDFENAIKLSNLSWQVNRRHSSTLRCLIIGNVELGRTETAKKYAETLLKMDNGFSVNQYRKFHPATKFKAGKRWANALEKAGIAA